MDYTYETIRQYGIDNIDYILGSMSLRGSIVERMSAEEDGHTFVNLAGYDQRSDDNERIETKSCHKIDAAGGWLRIHHMNSKRGKFDYLKIIVCVNNRKFIIPHDDFYDGRFHLVDDGALFWSGSYNTIDKVRMSNTQALLQYEAC
jgi:hypothetical protein